MNIVSQMSVKETVGWTDSASYDCITSFDNLLAQDREVLAQKSSALDDPTHHRMKHQMNDVSRIQRSSDMEGND
jgi:hypothetical protein